MKKSLTILVLMMFCSCSPQAHKRTADNNDKVIQSVEKSKIITAKNNSKKTISQKTTSSDDKYAEIENGSATLNSRPENPKSYTIETF